MPTVRRARFAPKRFNGATDFHRWKCREFQVQSPHGTIASMGPPIFIGGNVQNSDNIRRVEVASMGPPIFIGGNETYQGAVNTQYTASMGPPIFIGGNHWREFLSYAKRMRLQWGHRFSSVEIRSTRTIRTTRAHRFNGATDFHRWKSFRR